MEILNFKINPSTPATPFVSDILQGGKTISITFPSDKKSAIFVQQSTDGETWRSKKSVSPTSSATFNVSVGKDAYLRVLVSERPASASYKDYESSSGGGGISIEYDPTVPSWAKQPQKPTYTPAEIGAASNAEFNQLFLEMNRLEDELNGKIDSEETYNPLYSEIENNATINVTVSTTVAEAHVNGLTLRVLIDDNVDTLQEVVTDDNGKATFAVPSGSKFEVRFPHQSGCEDINAISRYAVKSRIDINVVYAPMATHYEALSIHILKWVGNVQSNFGGCPIHITIDGTTEDFVTGSDGRFEHEIPFGTTYEVSVDEVEDMYIYGHTRKWTYTASASHREKIINYHDVEVGLFMCCSDGAEYTKEEFIASGRAGSDVVMFKISNAQLAIHTATAPNGNVFGIDLNDVTEATYNINKLQWAGQNVQFSSCPNNQSADGFDRTQNIVNEGIERSIPTPAATFCFGKQFNLGGTELNGFLGATTQHLAIVSNEQELNAMLAIVRPEATKNFTTMIAVNKWTIDQSNASNAYYCAKTVVNSGKNNTGGVLPFYAF